MSDPAVDAARRAHARITDGMCTASSERHRVTAAREALAALRPIIEDARTWNPFETRDIGEAFPADSVRDLLDELSKLIYPSEEL